MNNFLDKVVYASSNIGYYKNYIIKYILSNIFKITILVSYSIAIGIYCFIVGKKVSK